MSSLQDEQEESTASVALVSDEEHTNECELLLKTLLSETASEASLKRTFTAAGKERDDAFAEFRKAQYKHSVLHSKHKQIQSELQKKSIVVKLIRDAYSKAKNLSENGVAAVGGQTTPATKEKQNGEHEFADTAEYTDEELLDLLRETERNLSKDGVTAVGGQTTSATNEQNEEHTGKKNCPTVQTNEKHSSEAVALSADASPAKKKRLIVQENEKHSSEEEHSGKKNGPTVQVNAKHSSVIVQENEQYSREAAALPGVEEEHSGKKNSPTVQVNAKHSSVIVQENEQYSREAAALPGVVGCARNRKEKENQSSEGASLPAVVSPPRNPPKKKNVSI